MIVNWLVVCVGECIIVWVVVRDGCFVLIVRRVFVIMNDCLDVMNDFVIAIGSAYW